MQLSKWTETKQGAVRAVRFNVDGNYCMTCGSDKSLKLWNPHQGLLLRTYTGHSYEVLDARASSDNGQICSCGMDKTVILWDVATGNILRKYRGHAGQVNCVQFNEQSIVILSGSLDGTIRAWDCRSRRQEPIQVMADAKDGVTSIDVSDHEVLSGSADGRVRRYDLRMGTLSVDHVGKAVTSVCFTKDGQCLLASTLDSTVRLFDKESGEMLNEYKGHKNTDYKTDCCLNHNDTNILSGSDNGDVFIWDLIEAKVLQSLSHPSGRTAHSLSHHPTENILLTVATDKFYLWKP